MRLSAAIDGFWLARQRDMSPNTVLDYSLTFRRLIQYLDDPPIETVTSTDIHHFLNHWSHKLSKKSVANMWIAISSLWTWAETEPALRLPHIVRGAVRQPEYTSQPVVPFVPAEIKKLLEATVWSEERRSRSGNRYRSRRRHAERDRAILLTLLDTGIRSSELCALRLEDYNAKRGRLHVLHGKGDKARVVYCGQRTRRAIWRYLARRGDAPPTAPLFATSNETHISKSNLYTMISELGERVGIDSAYPHRFRHTFAITYLRNGGDPLTLQRILGHESMTTVQIYVKLAEVDIERSQVAHSPADNWRL